MSASRDKSQKPTFVFTNLHSLYRKGVDAAGTAEVEGAGVGLVVKNASAAPAAASSVSAPPADSRATESREIPKTEASRAGVSGTVLKAQDLRAEAPAEPAVRRHSPPEFIAKRVARPPVLPPSSAVVSLRENLKALNELHQRLRFMLQELEDLVKD